MIMQGNVMRENFMRLVLVARNDNRAAWRGVHIESGGLQVEYMFPVTKRIRDEYELRYGCLVSRVVRIGPKGMVGR